MSPPEDHATMPGGPAAPPAVLAGLGPRQALRLACFWLGGLSLIATVALSAAPATGVVATLVAVAAMGYALVGAPAWETRRAWPHALAVLLAALAAFGLCASRCGSYAAYAEFLGLPTAVAAIVLHGAVALVALVQARYRPQAALVTDLAIALACGGSLFFATVMAASGTWCGACFAIHALMAVQLADLAVATRGSARVAVLATVLAAAGGANALYHHRDLPPLRNDPGELLAYLRGLWSGEQPPQRLDQVSEEVREAQRAGRESGALRPGPAGAAPRAVAAQERGARAAAGRMPVAGAADPLPPPPAPAVLRATADPAGEEAPLEATPVRARPERSTAVVGARAAEPAAAPPAPVTVPAARPIALANHWGQASAPVTMVFALDMGCPVCAQQLGQVLELADLIKAGRLQVRFLITYRNQASQATASLAYAAGVVGERPLVECLAAFMQHQRDIVVTADAMGFLPADFPPALAIATVRQHQATITTLMTDAVKLKDALGATGDPAIWLMVPGQAKPARDFQGLTMSSIIRLAAMSLMPAE